MPENKFNILSTKIIDRQLAETAAAQGFQIEDKDFIEIIPGQDPLVRDKVLSLSKQRINTVFTSANAVRMVKEMMFPFIPEWQIYCTGSATRVAVAAYFGESAIGGTASSASELGAQILKDPLVKELFFFCGELRRDDLRERLTAHHISLEEIIVYQTILKPHPVKGIYHGILFFSPSAVKSFFSVNNPPSPTLLFAIGQTTAAEIRLHSSSQVIISGKPEPEAMINQMIAFFQTHTLSIDHI